MSIINLSKQKNRFTQKQKYTFLGVTMGFLFPILGTLFESSFRNMGNSFYQFIELLVRVADQVCGMV